LKKTLLEELNNIQRMKKEERDEWNFLGLEGKNTSREEEIKKEEEKKRQEE
jgi:hypothetical protein